MNKNSRCIDQLVKTGNFKSLDYFLMEINRRGIKFRDALNNAINNVQRKLEDLHNKFRFEDSDFQVVSPAFQWAQSMNHVFIQIKFAHRHDSPGCLEIKDQSVELFKNMLFFKGYCVLGDIPIKFELNLEMFQNINKDESTWDFSSVGRFQLTLKKEMAGMYWDRLLKNAEENLNNMKVWFEMRAKYEDELKSYMEEDDENEFKREEEQIKKSAKEKRKRKKQEKKQKRKEEAEKAKNNNTTNDNDPNNETTEDL
jgi:hypothetical protein